MFWSCRSAVAFSSSSCSCIKDDGCYEFYFPIEVGCVSTCVLFFETYPLLALYIFSKETLICVFILYHSSTWWYIWALSQHKESLSWFRDFYYKDKTVVRLSYLYHGNSYTGNMASLYWDYTQVVDILLQGPVYSPYDCVIKRFGGVQKHLWALKPKSS